MEMRAAKWEEAKSVSLYNELLAARCFAAAFRGFKVLEDQGHDNKVQYRLGWMLLHGGAIERSTIQAVIWFS